MLICDRDAKWSAPVRERLGEAGIRVAQTPYQAPNAKGKLEPWFRTVRGQLVPTLTDADTRDLEALNRRLWVWIEAEYHYDPARAHRGVQVLFPGHPIETANPVDAYANCFVRRDHGTKQLTPQTPASHPKPGLPLRQLEEDF